MYSRFLIFILLFLHLVMLFYICVPDNLVSCCTSKINSPLSWPCYCCLISLSPVLYVRNFAFCRRFSLSHAAFIKPRNCSILTQLREKDATSHALLNLDLCAMSVSLHLHFLLLLLTDGFSLRVDSLKDILLHP